MWPLTGREIVEACGVRSWAPSVEAVSIAGVTLGELAPRPDELFVALCEDGYDGHAHVEEALLGGAALALVAADWAALVALDAELRARCLVVDDTLVAFRRLAAALRRGFTFPVVAVGGSNGKTTTKDLIAALLSSALGELPCAEPSEPSESSEPSRPSRLVTKTPETMNGWSGLPTTLTLRAHARSAPPDALVVEIGIDAVGAMAAHAALVAPDVAVLTALGPEHTAGLGDLAGVVREEMTLFEASPRARRVFQTEDPSMLEHLASAREGDVLVGRMARVAELARRGLAVLGYEVHTPAPTSCEVDLAWYPARPSEAALASRHPASRHGDAAEAHEAAWTRRLALPMAGRHNGDNLACAVAVALALGRTPDELEAGLATFVPPAMRCDVHELPNGCVLIDDAYNASPSSVLAALELLAAPAWSARPKLVILGDMLDLGAGSAAYHLALAAPLREVVARGARVCLFGAAMAAVHAALAAEGVATFALGGDDDPRAFLDEPGARLEGAVVLVKGSRGMHLERVVRAIARRSGALGLTEASDPKDGVGAEPSGALAGGSRDEVVTEADLAPFYDRFATACVTGTNGKTTTTSLIAAIVAASGETACSVTTLGARVGDEATGEAPTGAAFVRTLALAASRGVRTLAVETTSHALADGFARSWPSRVAVFTNLSRDHLDYHGTPEGYLAAKAQLFMALPADGVAILNVADPASALLDEVTPPGVLRLGYAARPPDPACAAIPLTVHAEVITVDERGTHARLAASPFGDALGGRLDLALVGGVHVENALAAALAGHALGYTVETIRAALATFAGVPGRFEVVHRRPLVVVDFAHTPDALARTLSVARSLVVGERGRVLCVFGCGGDRDPGKRREMGAIAGAGAEVVILTSDNPRSEDPERIADAIEEGASEGGAHLVRLMDRASAISRAVELARAGDIVVIAGKGHEKTQVVGDRALPFDDVAHARDAVAKREEDHHEG